jgi:hypothetical protein
MIEYNKMIKDNQKYYDEDEQQGFDSKIETNNHNIDN